MATQMMETAMTTPMLQTRTLSRPATTATVETDWTQGLPVLHGAGGTVSVLCGGT